MSDAEPSAYDKLEWGTEIFRVSDPDQCDAMPADKDIFDFQQDFYGLVKSRRDHLLAIFRMSEPGNGLDVNAQIEQMTGREVSHPTTYLSLNDLEQKGLISKKPVDSRSYEFDLTGKGRLTIRGGFIAFSQSK
jgi:DNA-binding MarR family transcriptional regulator